MDISLTFIKLGCKLRLEEKLCRARICAHNLFFMDEKIILQQEIVEGIKGKFRERKPNESYSIQKLIDDIDLYVKNAIDINKEIRATFLNAVKGRIKPDTIKRAFNERGDEPGGIATKNNPFLHELLCQYGFNNTYEKTLETIGLKANKNIIPQNLPQCILLINQDLFTRETITNSSILKKITVDYYLRFNNMSTNLMRVVANDIYIKPPDILTFKSEEVVLNTSIKDILAKADKFFPILIKILAAGGTGKSTLLFHLAKQVHQEFHTIYIRKIEPGAIFDYVRSAFKYDKRSLVILLDDISTDENNKERLAELGEIILSLSSTIRIALIISERSARFVKLKQRSDFEKPFIGYIYSVQYSTKRLLSDIFNKIFQCLQNETQSNNILSQTEAFSIFTHEKFESLVDRTFHFLSIIKRQHPKIEYNFDWQDWNKLCKDEYSIFWELYKIVASFYQFGVSVPLAFVKDYYSINGSVDLLTRLITHDANFSFPINIYRNEDGRDLLRLRHEKMGEWYFKIEDPERRVISDFFSRFLNSIQSKSYSYLFRNLTRNNYEFGVSEYRSLINNEKVLKIIDNYLSSVPPDEFDSEERKMLMDKHFILINLGKQEQSLDPLKTILKQDPQNVFAMHRLATCLQDACPDEAIALYQRILQKKDHSDDIPALLGLFRVYRAQNKIDEFKQVENRLFNLGKKDSLIIIRVINTIELHFPKLPNTTVDHLKKAYEENSSLGNIIAEIFIDKRKTTVAKEILFDIEKNAKNFNYNFRCRTIDIYIKAFLVEKVKDKNLLASAMQLIKFNAKNGLTDDAELLFLEARILSFQGSIENFEKIDLLFSRALATSPSERIVLYAVRFYKDAAKEIVLGDHKPYKKSIEILQKGMRLLNLGIEHKSQKILRFKIELCHIYSICIQILYYAKNVIADEYIYRTEIGTYEHKFETTMDECVSILKRRLPILNSNNFTNYVPDKNEVSRLINLSGIAFDYYRDKFKRSEIDVNKVIHFKICDELFSMVALFDSNSQQTKLNQILLKIILGDDDITEKIERLDFSRFSDASKLELCQALFNSNLTELAERVSWKLQQSDTDQNWIRKGVLKIYIETNQWGRAVQIVKNTKFFDNDFLELIREVAVLMPASNQEKCDLKIELSYLYLEKKKYYTKTLKTNICKTLFISCKIDESFLYFAKNSNIADAEARKHNSLTSQFKSLSKKWESEQVAFVKKNLYSIEKRATEMEKSDALELIVKYLKCILKQSVEFGLIKFNIVNGEQYYEDMRRIVGKSINIIFNIMDSKNKLSEQALNYFKSLFSLENILFTKLSLYLLIKIRSFNLYEKLRSILSICENTFSNEHDVIRMLARIHLHHGHFTLSWSLLFKCEKLQHDNIQASFIKHIKAEWFVFKIELEDLSSFGGIGIIKKNISSAEKLLNESKSLFLNKHQESLQKRVDFLKYIFCIS